MTPNYSTGFMYFGNIRKTNHLLMFFIIKILLKGTIQNVSTIRLRFIANLFGGKRVGMS